MGFKDHYPSDAGPDIAWAGLASTWRMHAARLSRGKAETSQREQGAPRCLEVLIRHLKTGQLQHWGSQQMPWWPAGNRADKGIPQTAQGQTRGGTWLSYIHSNSRSENTATKVEGRRDKSTKCRDPQQEKPLCLPTPRQTAHVGSPRPHRSQHQVYDVPSGNIYMLQGGSGLGEIKLTPSSPHGGRQQTEGKTCCEKRAGKTSQEGPVVALHGGLPWSQTQWGHRGSCLTPVCGRCESKSLTPGERTFQVGGRADGKDWKVPLCVPGSGRAGVAEAASVKAGVGHGEPQ